jgi:uncharacterized protein (TIGR03086 family)
MTDAGLGDLHDAGAALAQLVAGVGEDQWTAPTPCTEWTVAELVVHVTMGNRISTALLRGQERPGPAEQAPVDQLRPAFERSMAELQQAFGAPGALEQTVTLPIGDIPGTAALDLRVTELLVHGWDLGQATGQDLAAPERAVQRALAFSREFVHRIPPGRQPFAASQAVPEDAPALDRLVALLGREASSVG